MSEKPNIYRDLKHLSQAYENRKRHIEQCSKLDATAAREKVKMLQLNLSHSLDMLIMKLDGGELEHEHEKSE